VAPALRRVRAYDGAGASGVSGHSEENDMPRIRNLLIGGVVGAATAYFFDPELGPGRRARLQDEVGARLREGRRSVDRAARQLQDRTRGAVAQLESSGRPDDDLTVLSRVESAILGLPGLPRGAVDVEVVDGGLVLRGEVASEEQERELVETATHVQGVRTVRSQLRLPDAGAPDQAPASDAG
jgi:gas vesicle protein